MHTQHDTAQAILARQADYVMTVKANMPTLYRQLKKLPWAAVPSVSAVSTDHGRQARRTIKAVLAPSSIQFEGAARVAQLRRTVTRNGKKTVEVVYLITSDHGASPETWLPGSRPLAHREQEMRVQYEAVERRERAFRLCPCAGQWLAVGWGRVEVDQVAVGVGKSMERLPQGWLAGSWTQSVTVPAGAHAPRRRR